MYFDGYRVIGTSSDLPKLVEKNQVDLTLFTITNIDGVERSRILKNCQSARSRVVIFPDVMTELRSYFHPATGQKPVIPQAEYSTIGD